MGAIDFNLQKFDGEFKAAGMARVVKAAEAIRDAAKGFCREGTVTRIPGRKTMVVNGRKVESTSPPEWMERTPGAMKKTIRVVRLKTENLDMSKPENVRVYAGNKKTWWATQMEFGFGAWKGGAKPFLRPGLRTAESKARAIIEGK